ncbi:hypothetical protein ABT072_40970 [Streptomyces sp. NPDC002589]|uniref:hypothetical protein n=1 Tax=Streptomyces sp. NPDC002589 TaxID=3154420 RepID=UPI0033257610
MGFTRTESTAQDTPAQAPTMVAADTPATVASAVTSTGVKISQHVAGVTKSAGGGSLSPALITSTTSGSATGKHTQLTRTAGAAVSHDPTDPDPWCSVSRNDGKAQALQPTPHQVEWAVDMAVRGNLHASSIRQGGYRHQTD